MTNQDQDYHRSTEDFLRQQEAIDHEPTMADVMRELTALRDRVIALERELKLEHHKIEQTLKPVIETNEYLLAKMANLKPFVPFAETFPPVQNIVALQAQLFRNTGSGKAPAVIKVYVWDKERARNNPDERERWPDGYYRPFCFGLYAPKIFENDPKLQKTVTGLSADHRIGYLEHKGLGRGKTAKGTKRIEDHIGGLEPDNVLWLSIGGKFINFGTGAEAKPSEAGNSAVRLWYLNDLRL